MYFFFFCGKGYLYETFSFIVLQVLLYFSIVPISYNNSIISIPGRVIAKTLKMVLDTSLLNTRQYKVRIKGKVEKSKERSNVLRYTSV